MQNELFPGLVNRKTDWKNFKEELEAMVRLHVPVKRKEQLDNEVGLSIKRIKKTMEQYTDHSK